jgi:hypothetical protein
MKDSFENVGFTSNCEYLIADNTNQNNYDAYQAIGLFLKRALGRYIIVVHQDVRCIDTIKTMDECIADLNTNHSRWAICGNAGAMGYHRDIVHITYPKHQEIYPGHLPIEVHSLDENMLIINSSTNICISPDLKGFHLYGTDLCINAKFLGYQCFIIRFMVQHLSKGNLRDLKTYRRYFIDRYGEKIPAGFIQTTCTNFYLSNSKLKNRLFNSGIIFFFIKQFERYPYLLKQLIKKK